MPDTPKGNRIEAAFTLTWSSGATVDAAVTSLPQQLIAVAENLLRGQFWGAAIVTLHAAAEVATSRAMHNAFDTRNIADMRDASLDLLSSGNLGAPKVRLFYNGLTGRHPESLREWSNFKKSSERRNDVAHDGYIATERDARESLAACKAIIADIER